MYRTTLKKEFKGSKENRRPVSILSVISNLFKKFILKQITSFIDKILLKYQRGFRKGFSGQD